MKMPKIVVRNSGQLASALMRYRKLRDWTQKELGESAGLPQSSVAKIEGEMSEPNLGTVIKLLAALELEIVLRSRDVGPPASKKRIRSNDKQR